jgi:CheY-like chemotaxis protein
MVSPRLRVLVVDDHQVLGAGLSCLLEELGHEVVDFVGTGEEAITSAERYKPDLILMDVHLEDDMDGIEAASQIRRHWGIKSIFFSGYSDAETRKRASMAEPIAFLDKTSSKADLVGVINGFVLENAPVA